MHKKVAVVIEHTYEALKVTFCARVGKVAMAPLHAGSSLIPVVQTIWPKNSTSGALQTHFWLFRNHASR